MPPPLLEELRRQGALVSGPSAVAGVESFGDPDREASLAMSRCILVDLSAWGKLILRGKDRQDLLHRISTNEIKSLRPGQGNLTVLLNPRGRIVDLIQAVAGEEEMTLLTSAGSGEKVRAWIESFVFREEVEVADSTHGSIGLFGPQAPRILEDLTGEKKLEELPRAWQRAARLSGSPIRILRTFPLAGSGFLLLAPAEAMPDLWNALRVAGAVPSGAQALERLRVEAGVPALGRELSEDFNPWEAGLDQAISLTKGCYTGQEVVARLHTYKKVQRRIAGLILEAQAPPPTGAQVLQDERALGQVTSGAHAPNQDNAIALAYLALPHPGESQTLEVEDHGSRTKARLRSLPFPHP
jgi:folate-binding protein YgfZ